MRKTQLILLLLLPFLLPANDGFLGSIGGNVYPIFRNQQIRMSKEEIRIKMLKDSCIVSCKFWFTNQTNDTIPYVYMGFPDYFFVDEEWRSIALRNFTCKVNNKETKFKKHKEVITPSLEVFSSSRPTTDTRYWYCWHVWNIKPHETIVVENSYSGDWGGSAEGTCSFSYLIGTAQTWQGTIGNGKIVFDYSEIASKLFLDTATYSDSPINDEGMKQEIYDDSTVFIFQNYYPKWRESIGISLYPYWKPPGGPFNDTTSIFPFEGNNLIRHYKKEKLRLMRNEIYARHGFIFKDEYLKQYFASKHWYKPDASFKEANLNRYEQLFVRYLQDLEKE